MERKIFPAQLVSAQHHPKSTPKRSRAVSSRGSCSHERRAARSRSEAASGQSCRALATIRQGTSSERLLRIASLCSPAPHTTAFSTSFECPSSPQWQTPFAQAVHAYIHTGSRIRRAERSRLKRRESSPSSIDLVSKVRCVPRTNKQLHSLHSFVRSFVRSFAQPNKRAASDCE